MKIEWFPGATRFDIIMYVLMLVLILPDPGMFFRLSVLYLGAILLHEVAHFAMAGFLGVPASRFAIGGGPCLVATKIGGTRFEFRVFPFLGGVQMDGFRQRSRWERFSILLAGPASNLLLGLALFNLVGPSRMFQAMADAYAANATDLTIATFAAVNLLVGVVNLFPIPPMDGGKIALLPVEHLMRDDPQRFSKIENRVSYLGLLLLVFLMLTVPFLNRS